MKFTKKDMEWIKSLDDVYKRLERGELIDFCFPDEIYDKYEAWKKQEITAHKHRPFPTKLAV